MPANIKNWSPAEVAKWLLDNGLNEKTAAEFERHELTGDYLCDLTEQMLTELLPLIKDQIKFIRLLKTTKQSVSATLDNSEISYTAVVSSVISVNNEKGETTNSGSFPEIEEAECVHSQVQVFPFVYQLPLFPDNVVAKLQCQDKASFGLGSKSKALLIDALFDDLKRRDILYPTRRIYSAVSSAIILKYPFLADYDGSSNAIRVALRRKFKKYRQPLCSENSIAVTREKFGRPGVLGRKRKVDQVEINHPDNSTLSKTARVKLANVVQGEDDISIKKHQDALKKEIKKQTSSFDIIKDKMKRTCEYRQLFCHAHTTAEVLEEFPCLRLNIFQVPLSPVILSQDDEWNISVDKEVLFPKTICTFSAAFQAWFAAFWIFSIEFPKGLSNTCQFLEKVLLGGKGKVPNIVSKWGNRLLH
ncbi:uncharacterized protein LOC105843605 isoform X4 [Hydra vulgaris]|uniref:uncharacterized protein LOC105843605 isoform X4 n=1 Tax=Hydra vulgaris TaxID=6087 RepID=UPI0032EA5F23